MLLCSSRIPVSGELTADAFVTLAIEWVTNSRNYSFDPFGWDGSPDYTCVGKKQEIFQVGLFDEGAVCAVHFKAVDNREISWTTDFILDCANHILAFQLYRDAPEDVDYVHPGVQPACLGEKNHLCRVCRIGQGTGSDRQTHPWPR